MTSRASLLPLPSVTHPCAYLAGHVARFEHFLLLDHDDEAFCRLLEQGFRRFGPYFFRPACPGRPAAAWCGACVPLRVRADHFRPSRSQQRVLRRGRDVRLTVAAPQYADEKYELYLRHKQRFSPPNTQPPPQGNAAPFHPSSSILHPSATPNPFAALGETPSEESADTFRHSFYLPNPFTHECVYRLDGRIIAVSYIDVASRLDSSIYCYFDPAAAGYSPGTLSVLREIEFARERAIPHYYLGYFIHDNRSMRYKMDFRPSEVLDGGRWRPFRAAQGPPQLDPATLRTAPFDPLLTTPRPPAQ